MRFISLLVFLPALLLCQYVSSNLNLQPLDNRVTLELHFDSLCPYCKSFINGQLKSVLAIPNIWEIVNFRLIPFGNGNMKKQGTKYSFTCQHGQSECQGNILMNCALNLADIPSKAIPFILCLEGSSMNWDVDGLNCANTYGLNFTELRSCTNSLYGRHWLYQAGLETQIINVDHVPYIVVNGVYNANTERQATQNLLQVICRSYNGTMSLSACLGQTGSSSVNQINPLNNQNLAANLFGLLQQYPINFNTGY